MSSLSAGLGSCDTNKRRHFISKKLTVEDKLIVCVRDG